MADLSPFQHGYGSLQIFSVHQNVPSGLADDFLLTGLRRDAVTASAQGVFAEAPVKGDEEQKMVDDPEHPIAGVRHPSKSRNMPLLLVKCQMLNVPSSSMLVSQSQSHSWSLMSLIREILMMTAIQSRRNRRQFLSRQKLSISRVLLMRTSSILTRTTLRVSTYAFTMPLLLSVCNVGHCLACGECLRHY